MEQPKKDPSASEHQDEQSATGIPDPTDMQKWRWKDDGGAIAPEPDPEPPREANES
jgi:hypothetical protein